MQTLFADSWFYIALLDTRDAGHAAVVQYLKGRHARTVTTAWVLTEVAAQFCNNATRALFVQLKDQLEADLETHIVGAGHELYEQGCQMYRDYRDKDWSLVDGISFVVMRRRGLTDALTNDHHYEQAGFVRLFV